MSGLHVSWFSAGVSSAVATKLAIDSIDKVIYIHIDDQHPDTLRFVKDCEAWFGKPVEIIQHWYKSVEMACRMRGRVSEMPEGYTKGYINGINGASCTKYLKRRLRKEWEAGHTEHLHYYWGMDIDEQNRCDSLLRAMPESDHHFPLIDRQLTKEATHKILAASGIKRPAMYDLGYHNNNCVGCVKGGMGYWNKIRVDFPEVFAKRAAMERVVQATCIKGVYLDELDPNRGRHEGPICEDCGAMCEIIKL